MISNERQKPEYRSNIAAFVMDSKNKFLFCHRNDVELWTKGFQVPQGGIEEGESLEEALSRELKEEIGLDSYKILGKIKIPFAIGGILMNQTEVHLI